MAIKQVAMSRAWKGALLYLERSRDSTLHSSCGQLPNLLRVNMMRHEDPRAACWGIETAAGAETSNYQLPSYNKGAFTK